MSIKSWTGFIDMFVNLKEVVTALRAQDKAAEQAMAAMMQEIAIQRVELRHLHEKLDRLESRTSASSTVHEVFEAPTQSTPRRLQRNSDA